MALEKSQILKFKIQHKIFYKKDAENTFKCSKFLNTNDKSLLGCLKCKKTCNFLNFLKESNNFRFLAIFSLKKWVFVNIKKIENI